MKPKIAVIYGGYSSEHDISVQSGQYVASVINPTVFDVYQVHISRDKWLVDGQWEIDRTDFSFIKNGDKIRFDAVVILIHGTPGEDGILQAYFDLLNIPYVSCNAVTSALTFHKHYCNHYLHDFGIKTAKSLLIKPDDIIDPQEIEYRLGLPVFVKPDAGGSSFGTTKVKDIIELLPAIDRARRESADVLIESFVKGREITVGVVKYKGKVTALTPCEVRSKKEFFDYEAKYNPDLNEEIIPAPIDRQLLERAKNLAENIYKLIGCNGIVRIDFILSEEEQDFYFLELNSIPGMTSASIVPKMLRHDNLNITDLYTELIFNALKNKKVI